MLISDLKRRWSSDNVTSAQSLLAPALYLTDRHVIGIDLMKTAPLMKLSAANCVYESKSPFLYLPKVNS